MIGWVLKNRAARFGERYGYDTGYFRNLTDIDRSGAFGLALASFFVRYRFGLASGPYFAARIVATRHADCGPCLKLAIDMAVDSGVPSEDIRTLLPASEQAPPGMRLAARYAHAVLNNDPALPKIVEECTRRWGRRGLAGLAAAVAGGLLHPVFKRGLGYGDACTLATARLQEQEAAGAGGSADAGRG